MTVLNKYKKVKPIILLNNNKNYDFVLSLDSTPSVKSSKDDGLICYVNCNEENVLKYGGLMSDSAYTYNNSINDGYKLDDIGLTATDNGLIKFNKNTCTEIEYINIIEDSVANIKKDDFRLYLFPVSGNTEKYTYDTKLINESGNTYYNFNGGFLQGVFKGFGYDYQILPKNISNALTMEFILRPTSDVTGSTTTSTTINDTYKNNKGIFFYVGTRAENKFIQFYNYDLSGFKKRSITNNYSGKTINDLSTSEFHKIENKYKHDIVTDNGYLIYNRGNDCITVNKWKQGDKLNIINEVPEYKENLFLLMNRTSSGFTTNTLLGYSGETLNNSNNFIHSDVVNNAFGLRITEDGRIGYRYIISDCDSELYYKVIEEYSFPNIVSINEWNTIHVVMKILNGELDKCEQPIGDRKMVIYIYVNGYLKFISKELPEINLRELDDNYEKQEMVPYSISLGGGTQGLLESTWVNSYDGFPYILPIEENFAGTFIGDIKSFKIYDRMLEYQEIKNNF